MLDAHCKFMECDCGQDCSVCTVNGCGCSVEEEVDSCKCDI